MSWFNDYVGIPYLDGGRDRSGADCAGLVCLVYREICELDVDEKFGFYDPQDKAEAAHLIEKAQDNWHEISIKEALDFDVVVLNMYSEPCHVGIVCNYGKSVLNVRRGVNAVIEPLDRGPWSTRIDSVLRKLGNKGIVKLLEGSI